MTDQIASITLRADVSDLKTASNELDKLGQAAASAVAGADALADATKRVKPSAKKGLKPFGPSTRKSKASWRASTRPLPRLAGWKISRITSRPYSAKAGWIARSMSIIRNCLIKPA